jgi:hypothetical protein
MRKRVRLLLASTIAAAGLAAGVGPAPATAQAEEIIGSAWLNTDFSGVIFTLNGPASSCTPIHPSVPARVRSASNSSEFSIIIFYRQSSCDDVVGVLYPGEEDSGIGTLLGEWGARAYSTTT